MTGSSPTPSGRELLSIGLAAAHIGVHPQTLREYERQGLLTPHRTPGGTRRYGAAELERLARVQRLTAEGLSLAGVRHVLEVEEQLAAARRRIARLESALAARDGVVPVDDDRPRAAGRALVVHRSVSLELVHVPRRPRSPRWRNDG